MTTGQRWALRSSMPRMSSGCRRPRPRHCGASRARRCAWPQTSSREQDAAALVSVGHTGATVMAAHAAFGMMNGVDRPALACTIPTRTRPAVLLDAGANVECRPQHLLQFGVMGSVVQRVAFGVERPSVGLLSIGEEATKGNELTREAHRLLKAAPINFIGNIEGREIYSGVADVVVCDGFTGNVVLKTSEGLVETVEIAARRRAARDVFESGRVSVVPPGIPSVPSPARLLRVRWRGVDWRRGTDDRRSRPIVGEGRAQRDCTWRIDSRPPTSCIVSNRKSAPRHSPGS